MYYTIPSLNIKHNLTSYFELSYGQTNYLLLLSNKWETQIPHFRNSSKIHSKNRRKIHYRYPLYTNTVDSRYLEFDGTMEKIRVNRSSTQEELRRYRKCGLFNNERETTRAKFWRAKTSIACPYSRNDFKHIRCFCCCLNSLNLVKRLITSRYLFLCEWICLSVLFMFFTCCIVIKLNPSWRIFLCAILFIYNKWCVFIIQ